MSTQEIKAAHEAEPTELSDDELKAFLARAGEDPAAARVVALLQKQGFALLHKLVRDTVMRLAALEASGKAAPAGAIDVRQLTGRSREREYASKQRIELAEEIVLNALINLDNPDWDPLDPSTGKTSGANPLLTLLCP